MPKQYTISAAIKTDVYFGFGKAFKPISISVGLNTNYYRTIKHNDNDLVRAVDEFNYSIQM